MDGSHAQNADSADGLLHLEARTAHFAGTTLLITSEPPLFETIPLGTSLFPLTFAVVPIPCAPWPPDPALGCSAPIKKSKPCIKSELHELYPNKA